jgi:hypothetical protein
MDNVIIQAKIFSNKGSFKFKYEFNWSRMIIMRVSFILETLCSTRFDYEPNSTDYTDIISININSGIINEWEII